MRKALWSVAFVVLLLAVSLAAGEKGKSETWTGWLSDSSCAAKGMNAAHKDCALRCVKEKGAKWVFVNSKTQQVFNIDNQDAVKDDHVGKEVKLTGTLVEDKSIHVESIKPAE